MEEISIIGATREQKLLEPTRRDISIISSNDLRLFHIGLHVFTSFLLSLGCIIQTL